MPTPLNKTNLLMKQGNETNVPSIFQKLFEIVSEWLNTVITTSVCQQ